MASMAKKPIKLCCPASKAGLSVRGYITAHIFSDMERTLFKTAKQLLRPVRKPQKRGRADRPLP